MSFLHLPHSKKQEHLKFEITVTVKLMENLPAKYKHLRLTLTRGAKAVSTKEIFAVNQRSEPTAADGTMKMVSTMYRTGTTGKFEEKTYKLSLLRINPRALREREKKIGSSYIDLSHYVNPQDLVRGTTEVLKVHMKVSESDHPAILSLSIHSQWLQNYKGQDGDVSSDISQMNCETSSQGTSHSSIYSIEEEDEDENPPRLHLDDSPSRPGILSPGASSAAADHHGAAVRSPSSGGGAGRLPSGGVSSASTAGTKGGGADEGGGEREEDDGENGEGEKEPAEVTRLREELLRVQADLAWTAESLRDREKALDEREAELAEERRRSKKLESDVRKAMNVQEELMQENERAERQYEALLAEMKGATRGEAAAAQTAALKADVDRLKAELAKLKEERDDMRHKMEDERDAREEAEAGLRAAAEKAGRAGDLESQLDKERARAAKYKAQLEQAKGARGALEAELALYSASDSAHNHAAADPAAAAAAAAVAAATAAAASGPEAAAAAAAAAVGPGDGSWAVEMERLSLQMVTASLAHAQAEQDRLEAKQQVYRLKDANRKLRERLTAVELQLARAKSSA